MENGDFSIGVGQIPSGLFLVTAQDQQKMDGFLASWIQQISFQPLLLMVSIKPGRPCYDLILNTMRICINIVGHQNEGVMKPFWGAFDPHKNPFENLRYHLTDKGFCVLDACMAYIEGQVQNRIRPGDHELLIIKVLDSKILKSEDKPLIHTRKNGLVY